MIFLIIYPILLCVDIPKQDHCPQLQQKSMAMLLGIGTSYHGEYPFDSAKDTIE